MKIIAKYKWMLLGVLCLSQSLYSWDDQEGCCESSSGFGKFATDLADEYWHAPLRISHTEGNGIGYNTGYTTAETFLVLPDVCDNDWVPFLDLRTHLLNNGKWAQNTGFGIRYIDSCVWGANIFWDSRRSFKHTFNQVGFGLESLGTEWDFRINGYLPFGRQHKTHLDITGAAGAPLSISEHTTFAMKGVNAEVGAIVAEVCDFSLYAAIGPYYFNGFKKHAFGGKSRLALDCWEYVTLNVIGSYDNIFKSIVQGRIDLRIPLFGCKQTVRQTEDCSCAENLILRKKSTRQVERFQIMVLDRKHSDF